MTLKKLNEASLKVGDIILTTTTAAVSKAIRVATRSDISHAMVYVQGHSVIDATGEGVHARNTQRLFFEDDYSVYVLRLRDGLTADQVKTICTFVRNQIGTQYSKKEAIRTAFGGAQEWTRKQFCSRLVAQAYSSAGIVLVDDPNFCSPADLKASPLLLNLKNTTESVSADQAAQWEGLDDIPQRMRDAINVLLDGARTKNKNVQNCDDLDRHLVDHPEDDEFVCGLLESSGYLTVWNIEKEKNPWQYDLSLMRQFAAGEPRVEEYCWGVLANEELGPNRFIVNRGGYAQLFAIFPRRTFNILMELYDLLATLHRRRVDVAAKWLEEHGLLAPVSERVLRPHTDEWFAALEVWNPTQAAMTRMAIASAGNPYVCSVCGDDPARDYRLEETYRPPGGVDTLRLCDDCLETRKNGGQPFVPLVE